MAAFILSEIGYRAYFSIIFLFHSTQGRGDRVELGIQGEKENGMGSGGLSLGQGASGFSITAS